MKLGYSNSLIGQNRPRGSAFVGPLDDYTTGLVLAYSLARRLLASYTGPLIRVRRSSDDEEMDFGADANGDLDTGGLLAFCGSGDGFVHYVYLQGGIGAALGQDVKAAQSKIVSAGVLVGFGGFPSMKSGNWLNGYEVSLGQMTPTALSYSFVGVAGGAGDYFGQVGGPGAAYAPGGAGLLHNETSDEVNCHLDWSGRGNAITVTSGARAALGCVLGPSALTFYQAGVANTPAAYTPSFDFDTFGLWRSLSVSASPPAQVCEMILWTGDQSAALAALGAEQASYYGT